MADRNFGVGMAPAIREARTMTLTSIKHGVYGGLAGGLVFGAMMGIMGMLSMIGNMMGMPSAWGGFLIHMVISAMIGGAFALLVQWTGWRGGVAPGWPTDRSGGSSVP
jgi:hypothetical protein